MRDHRSWTCLAFSIVVAGSSTNCAIAPSEHETPGSPSVSGQGDSAYDPVVTADTLVIVVRHAEKGSDDPVDPSLSVEGMARAQALASVLEHANISAIFTSQFRRTRQTAIPLSDASGVPIEIRSIEGGDAGAYAAKLAAEITAKHAAQTVLVVGHTNTVPETVEALSGVAVPPIPESEFDRLYTIAIGEDDARVIVSKY